ncbi:MAG TPA: ornithine--oxo-acid transaminase, partial [Gammaproteobacteria bacterium]|nr:ornithine--oxo-acid transaminase [Gammaproteobacteria bacterium]
MNQTDRLIAQVERISARNYAPLPVVITRGQGVWVWDTEGRRYLDCLSAYSSLSLGHCHPRVVEALNAQAQRLTLTSRAFHNDRMGPFLELLCELCAMEMALPMNTGAEAIETAIKLARKWGYRVKNVPRDQAEIIVCRGNFHGRTTTIVGFSSEDQYKDGFGPFTPGFRILPYGDFDAVREAMHENVAAILVEPIQGEGGIIIPPDGYLKHLRALCDEHRSLLMVDEIQSGLGRTGKLFAYQHEDVEPDVVIIGKAVSGGLYPVSAILSTDEVMSVFHPGDHG